MATLDPDSKLGGLPRPRGSWLAIALGGAGLLALLNPERALVDLGMRSPAGTAALATVLAGLLLLVLRDEWRARRLERAREAAYDAMHVGILIVGSDAVVIDANATARVALAIEPGGILAAEPLRALLDGAPASYQRIETPSGRVLAANVLRLGARAGDLRAVVLRDITEQRREHGQLLRLAHFDSLTGLANRRLFLARLGRALRDAGAAQRHVALLYVDLDRFKQVNDSLGHPIGDELLRAVAARLVRNVRAEDPVNGPMSGASAPRVARLAGDEFTVIVPDVVDPESLIALARRLTRAICEPIELDGHRIESRASVGIAISSGRDTTRETLIRHADAALLDAKSKGGGAIVMFEPSMIREASRERRIVQQLPLALQRGEFRLHYQPKVDAGSRAVVGFEALLRWSSTELGPVPPKDFISVAERSGLLTPIGAWCIGEACRQMRTWRDAGFAVVPVSVNVSSSQFRDADLRLVVGNALREHRIEPQMLELELTESIFLDDCDDTAIGLRDLRGIGVRIALDDFGTGYSALTYLNRIPLDTLKLDRGFLRDVESSDAARDLVATVVRMAHRLSLEVVAEGVDSEEQLAHLEGMGCDQIQGFLFSPALPPDDASRYLAPQGQIAGPVAVQRKPEEQSTLATSTDTAEVRALIVSDGDRSLDLVALRLTRLGVGVHHVANRDEAQLMLGEEPDRIRLLIVGPRSESLSWAIRHCQVATQSGSLPPALLVIGEEPGASERAQLRAMGAGAVLWAPFDDAELRFFVNSSMARPASLQVRHHLRVPYTAAVSIRAGSERDVAVLADLSPGGAFVEMDDPLAVGERLRLDFEVAGRRYRLFGRVAHRQEDSLDAAGLRPTGIGVVFEPIHSEDLHDLREAVELRAAHYRA